MFTISIVSDVVCPWCFIGTRRLTAAVEMVRARHPDFRHATHWRPFFLNPDTPPEGEPYLPFLEHKFGSRARVEEIFALVRKAGAAYGLEYAFEKIRLRANTLMAHRLIFRAQQSGRGDAVVEQLFQAQFQRGEHVGDLDVLCAIAEACGLPADTREYLASDADSEVVREDARQLRALGISMVPTFILPDGRIIVGAEDPTVLANAILEAQPT